MNKIPKAEEYLKKQFGEDWEHLSLSAESVKKLLIDFAEINAHDNESAPVDDVVDGSFTIDISKSYIQTFNDGHKKGQASRQPEIDALKKRVEELEKSNEILKRIYRSA